MSERRRDGGDEFPTRACRIRHSIFTSPEKRSIYCLKKWISLPGTAIQHGVGKERCWKSGRQFCKVQV